MPLYEYICNECGNKQEELFIQLDDSQVLCSACGVVTQKIISLPRIKTDTRGMFGSLNDAKKKVERTAQDEW